MRYALVGEFDVMGSELKQGVVRKTVDEVIGGGGDGDVRGKIVDGDVKSG